MFAPAGRLDDEFLALLRIVERADMTNQKLIRPSGPDLSNLSGIDFEPATPAVNDSHVGSRIPSCDNVRNLRRNRDNSCCSAIGLVCQAVLANGVVDAARNHIGSAPQAMPNPCRVHAAAFVHVQQLGASTGRHDTKRIARNFSDLDVDVQQAPTQWLRFSTNERLRHSPLRELANQQLSLSLAPAVAASNVYVANNEFSHEVSAPDCGSYLN